MSRFLWPGPRPTPGPLHLPATPNHQPSPTTSNQVNHLASTLERWSLAFADMQRLLAGVHSNAATQLGGLSAATDELERWETCLRHPLRAHVPLGCVPVCVCESICGARQVRRCSCGCTWGCSTCPPPPPCTAGWLPGLACRRPAHAPPPRTSLPFRHTLPRRLTGELTALLVERHCRCVELQVRATWPACSTTTERHRRRVSGRCMLGVWCAAHASSMGAGRAQVRLRVRGGWHRPAVGFALLLLPCTPLQAGPIVCGQGRSWLLRCRR